MSEKSICRIGIFYDGSYFNYAQRYFYRQRKLGWIDLRQFHTLVESYVRITEQGYNNYKVVYAAWFQGIFHAAKASEQQLRFDRNLHHDLLHAGIEPKYLPMSQSGSTEKGADVALAIDAIQVGLEGKIDVAALVSGDGDLVPLARALMKHGVRAMAVYFEYEEGEHKSFINERLLAVCNYAVNVNELEKDKDFKTAFRTLFRKAESVPVP